jgi:hypothetical protein
LVNNKIMTAAFSGNFLDGLDGQDDLFEMLLKGGLKWYGKKGLNEIQISTGGRTYLQVAGLGCFHPTNHQSTQSVICPSSQGLAPAPAR